MNLTRWIFAVVLGGAVLITASAARAAEPTAKAEAETAHTAAAGEHEPDRNPMAADPDLAVFSFVIFLLLVAVLGKFAWPSITAALDERERKIADNIAAAAARHEDAKRLLAEHEAKLAAAAGEVREMLEEARRDADHTRKSIEAKGHQAAQDELARALREIERAKDGALQEMAEKSVNVAIDLAGKMIRAKLTSDEQSQIVRDALSKLSAATPSKN